MKAASKSRIARRIVFTIPRTIVIQMTKVVPLFKKSSVLLNSDIERRTLGVVKLATSLLGRDVERGDTMISILPTRKLQASHSSAKPTTIRVRMVDWAQKRQRNRVSMIWTRIVMPMSLEQPQNSDRKSWNQWGREISIVEQRISKKAESTRRMKKAIQMTEEVLVFKSTFGPYWRNSKCPIPTGLLCNTRHSVHRV